MKPLAQFDYHVGKNYNYNAGKRYYYNTSKKRNSVQAKNTITTLVQFD